MRKISLKLTYKIVLAAASLAVLDMTAEGKEYKLAHFAATDHPNHIAVVEMAKQVEDRTKGEVQIRIYPNNELGSPPEIAEQARLGVIDFAMLSPTQLDKYDRAFGTVSIPYQFDDYEHAHRTLDKNAIDFLRDHTHKVGFEHVAYFEWGFRALTTSRRPVNTPDDVKGLKLRVPPEIQVKASMEALGAVTVTIAFPEVYTALATGTVDGQDNPVATIYSQKFYEVQKHLALTKHVYTPMMLVANARLWQQLTPEQHQIITEEAVRAGNEARRMVQDKEEWYIAQMEKTGIQTTRPDVAKFRATMGPAYKTVKDYVGAANWDAWEKLVEEARKK